MRGHRFKQWLHDHPAWVLFVTAPVLAEVFSGSTPLNEFVNPLAGFPLMMLYGSGAVLAREAVVRWRKGWFSLLLLGFAYGIYEEGLVVRSFFNPHWVDLGRLGVYGRVGGVNWVWTEELVIFHALISIAATVAFVEIMLPEHRREPWLHSRWAWAFHGLNLALMLAIGRAFSPYDAPNGGVLLCWLSIGALVGLARVLPTRRAVSASPRRVPPPAAFFFLGMGGMFLMFFLVSQGADAGRYPYPVAMALLALEALAVLALAWRWSEGGTGWDDRHRFAFLAGGLSFFLVFMPLVIGREYPVMVVSNPFFLLLLAWAYRRVARRVAAAA